MGSYSRRKGVRGELQARDIWRAKFPDCERMAQRRGDAGHADLANTGRLHIEVKHGYSRYMRGTMRRILDLLDKGDRWVILDDGHAVIPVDALIEGRELKPPVRAPFSAVSRMRGWVEKSFDEADDGMFPIVHYQYVGGANRLRRPILITKESYAPAVAQLIRNE